MKVSKWMILFLASMVTFGGYYSFDVPSVLHNTMFRYFTTHHGAEELANFEFQFSVIYSIYSLPNMFLPLVGGFMFDKLGPNVALFLFGSLVLFGNVVISAACFYRSMQMYIAGRFIFGLGAEALGVTASGIISMYFKSQELAFALGVNLSFCKLAGVLTDWFSPYFDKQFGFYGASNVVTFICFICFLLTLVLIACEHPEDESAQLLLLSSDGYDEEEESAGIDDCRGGRKGGTSREIEFSRINNTTHSRSSERMKMKTDQEDENGEDTTASEHAEYMLVRGDDVDTDREGGPDTGIAAPGAALSGYHGSSNSYQHGGDMEAGGGSTTMKHDRCYHRNQHEHQHEHEREVAHNMKKKGHSHCDTLSSFPVTLWILLIYTFFMYGLYIPFSNIANALLVQIYFGGDRTATDPELQVEHEQTAAWLQSIPYALAVLLSPLLGLACDWFGWRTAQMTASAALFLVGHTLITEAHEFVPAAMPLFLFGIGYSLFGTVIWACVPLLVTEEHVGTAYGFVACFQNAGQFLLPFAVERVLRGANHEFMSCEHFFVLLSCVGLALALILQGIDEKYFGGILRLPTLQHDDNKTGDGDSVLSSNSVRSRSISIASHINRANSESDIPAASLYTHIRDTDTKVNYGSYGSPPGSGGRVLDSFTGGYGGNGGAIPRRFSHGDGLNILAAADSDEESTDTRDKEHFHNASSPLPLHRNYQRGAKKYVAPPSGLLTASARESGNAVSEVQRYSDRCILIPIDSLLPRPRSVMDNFLMASGDGSSTGVMFPKSDGLELRRLIVENHREKQIAASGTHFSMLKRGYSLLLPQMMSDAPPSVGLTDKPPALTVDNSFKKALRRAHSSRF